MIKGLREIQAERAQASEATPSKAPVAQEATKAEAQPEATAEGEAEAKVDAATNEEPDGAAEGERGEDQEGTEAEAKDSKPGRWKKTKLRLQKAEQDREAALKAAHEMEQQAHWAFDELENAQAEVERLRGLVDQAGLDPEMDPATARARQLEAENRELARRLEMEERHKATAAQRQIEARKEALAAELSQTAEAHGIEMVELARSMLINKNAGINLPASEVAKRLAMLKNPPSTRLSPEQEQARVNASAPRNLSSKTKGPSSSVAYGSALGEKGLDNMKAYLRDLKDGKA
jgi:hypothetical protein